LHTVAIPHPLAVTSWIGESVCAAHCLNGYWHWPGLILIVTITVCAIFSTASPHQSLSLQVLSFSFFVLGSHGFLPDCLHFVTSKSFIHSFSCDTNAVFQRFAMIDNFTKKTLQHHYPANTCRRTTEC